jgi:NAD(P)-dependent dehydrogenase (short-subunit alcohol dehydrogenase family)
VATYQPSGGVRFFGGEDAGRVERRAILDPEHETPRNFHFDFNQKRVLVTGAGKGIGRETATMLHRFNAQVVALSRTEADLQSLQNEIGCETIIAELGDAGSARRAAEQAGEIDLLANNAAIAILELFLKTSADAWDKTMAVKSSRRDDRFPGGGQPNDRTGCCRFHRERLQHGFFSGAARSRSLLRF